MNKLLWNDIKRNKALSLITVFFMAVSAMLLALTAALSASLLGTIDHLMNQAQVPDYMQMHMGELDEGAISRFAESRTEVEDWQICRFLNLENSRLCLGNSSFAESTQDNGLCMQGERFDFLLDMGNQIPEVLPGEVYVPVCYRSQYALEEGDFFTIGEEKLMIAGFVRDAQMNSMMASSKRFLVNETDYNRIAAQGASVKRTSDYQTTHPYDECPLRWYDASCDFSGKYCGTADFHALYPFYSVPQDGKGSKGSGDAKSSWS